MKHPFTRAILTVSFGTSVKETRAKTLEAIEHIFHSAYPDFLHERAWTSKMLRAKVLEAEGLKIYSVQEALSQMKADGIQDVYIQPTFVTNGGEFQKLVQEAMDFQNQFRTLRIGSPLMECAEDLKPIVCAVTHTSDYQHPKSDELLLFMGHGTSAGDDWLYDQLDHMLQSCDIPNLFLKTMNDTSSIEEIIAIARERRITKVTLAPFMIVAGRHALKDMAGDHADSWKSRLELAGFQVHCELRGIGELPEIQRLFLHKLDKTGINH